MKKFEYRVLTDIITSLATTHRELEELGEEGWELISVVITKGGDTRIYLKREL